MVNTNKNTQSIIKEIKMILSCKCDHKFQDENYGVGNRVHNIAIKKLINGKPGYRCTVCGNVRSKT